MQQIKATTLNCCMYRKERRDGIILLIYFAAGEEKPKLIECELYKDNENLLKVHDILLLAINKFIPLSKVKKAKRTLTVIHLF